MPNEPGGAGHRLPNELLEEIAGWASATYPYSGDLWFDIPELVKFSFVCLRWAQLCRPSIWRTIDIKSETRHRSICAILDEIPPPSLLPVKDLIHQLDYSVSHEDKAPPWFHRLCSALTSRLSHPPLIKILVNVQDRSTLRSLLPLDLPRTLPGTLGHPSLTKLYLEFDTSVRFASRSALLRLLAMAPQLRELVCGGISWVSDTQPVSALALNSNLALIYLNTESPDVNDMCWWLRLLIGHRSRPTSRDARALQESCVLRDTDLAAIISTMRCVLEHMMLDDVTIVRKDETVDANLHHVGFELQFHSRITIGGMLRIDICYTTTDSASTPGDPTLPRIANIAKVKFRFNASSCCWSLLGRWSQEKWARILSHISSITTLERLCLSFGLRADRQRFVERFGKVSVQATIFDNMWIMAEGSVDGEAGDVEQPFREVYEEMSATKLDAEPTENTGVNST